MSTAALSQGAIALRTGQVDLGRQRLIGPDGVVPLTTRESELLAYLAARAGEAVPREDLLVDVWNYRATNPTRAVDLAVKRLRSKIEPDPSNPVHILSVHGVGYRFVPVSASHEVAVPEPASSEPLVRTNLAPDRTTFVGRLDELARLDAAVTSGQRLITVLGTAGTGKTRLARRFAAGWVDRMPGGVWFVELADARSNADALGAVVQALQLPVDAAADVDTVGVALAQRMGGRGLLVLDNFEQIVRAASDLARWLDLMPQLTVVVTSRERLHVRGELLLELAPLPPDDALELLIQRAAAVRRRGADALAFPPEERQVLADVVARLDGIPLAIELAASRLGTLSPSQLAARLDKRFRLLDDRRSDRPARHVTLQAAFDWSWELLDPQEQAALARLAVFEGGFSLEAAEELLDDADPGAIWPADLVQSLRDKSFVVLSEGSGSEVRCRLLESVREYALRKLELAGELEATRARHAAYFVREGERLAERVQSSVGLDRLDDLARERANLAAVAQRAPAATDRVRAALVLIPLLVARGPQQVLESVLEQAIVDARGLDSPRELGRLLVARASLEVEGGVFPAAEQDVDEAMRVAALHLDVRARALTLKASLAQQAGRAPEALTLVREAVELAGRTGDRPLEGRIRRNLARLLEATECIEEADAEYLRALRIIRRAGDRWTEGAVLAVYATFLLTRRHASAEALAMARDARSLLEAAGDRRRATRLQLSFGEGLARMGRSGEALAELESARQLCVETGDRGREAHVLFMICWCRIDLGDAAGAEVALNEGLRLARAVGRRAHEAVGQRLRGLLRLQQERFVEARALLEESAHVLVEVGFPAEAAVALHGLALLHLCEGREEEAVDALDQALGLQVAAPWLAVQATALLAVVHGLLGQVDAAATALASWEGTVRAEDRREQDLVAPCRLTVGLLAARGDRSAEDALATEVRRCLSTPAVALEGRVVRRILERVWQS